MRTPRRSAFGLQTVTEGRWFWPANSTSSDRLSSGRSLRSRWIGHFGNQTHNTRGMVDLPDLGGASQAAPAIQHLDTDPSGIALASR